MSTDMIVETRLVKTGRPTGVYEAATDGCLRLKEIIVPNVSLPFDVAILPNPLTKNCENLQVILIGDISHPPQTQVTTRIVGGVQKDEAELFLLGVPVADDRYARLNQIADLPLSYREELFRSVELLFDETNELLWLDRDTAYSLIREAVARFHQVKLESGRETSNQPSWRPADRGGRIVGYSEVEHYTDAEYTYFQLPYRFQHYMDQHLANNERILFALSRPVMRSHLQRTWLSHKKLQECVLIMTNQRLIQLVELVPPGSSGVRYGFKACMGILERLDAVSINTIENESLVLQTGWRAGDGLESLAREFPQTCQTLLEGLKGLLSKFINDSNRSSALRRASLPHVPETIPVLKDPAANNPEDTKRRLNLKLPYWLVGVYERRIAQAEIKFSIFSRTRISHMLRSVTKVHCCNPDITISYRSAS